VVWRYTPRVRRLGVLLGALVRLALIVALVAAVVALPLVTVYRLKCKGESPSYKLVAPWKEEPRECGAQSGLDLLRSELGLD
jgi:hypothetical protein